VLQCIEIEQGRKILRLPQQMNITALKILDWLRLRRFGIAGPDDADRNGYRLGQLRGAETTGSSYDLEAPFRCPL
jgi:hypothetical protein